MPSFWNQFVWDDEQFIYRNTYVKEFQLDKIWAENTIAGAGEISNYYRPLTTMSFAIDYALWGLRPFGFHLTNVLLHVGSGLLLYLLLRELNLFEDTSRLDLNFWVSLLFLIHPLQTEAVSYMNSRGDSLFIFFVLLGLHSFVFVLRHIKNLGSVHTFFVKDFQIQVPSLLMILAPPFFFIASVLSKEIALASAGLYFLILGKELLDKQSSWYHFSWSQRFASLSVLADITVLVGVYLWLRATVLNFANSFNFYGGENLYTSQVSVRLITFAHIFFEYVRLLFIPYPLHMERNPAIYTQPLSWATVSVFIIIFLIAGAGWWEWKRFKKVSILFGAAWFSMMMVPVSGLVPINGLMYEHWLYVPMIGFWLLVLRVIEMLVVSKKTAKYAAILNKIFVVWSVVLALLTLRQNYLWRDPISFYTYTLQYANSARLHNNLAMAYADAGNYQAAIHEYKAAIERADVYPQTHYNLANSYAEVEQYDLAEKEWLRALEIDPSFYLASNRLLQLYLHQQNYQAALNQVESLLNIEPQHPQLLQLKQELEGKLKTQPHLK